MKTGILLGLVAAVVLASPALACPAHHGKGACKSSDAKAGETSKAATKDANAGSSDTAKTAAPAK